MSIKKYVTLAGYISNWTEYFKRRSDKGETVRYYTKGNRLAFDVPPAFYHVFREMFMEDFYHFKTLAGTLPKDAIVLDIGANVGYFTFQLLAAKPKAMVYAYEPMQQNINLFTANIALNPGLAQRVKLYKNAVTGSGQDNIEIFFDGEHGNSVIASVYKDFAAENTRSEVVEAITLDHILRANNLTHVHLLKLDCEGSEYPILYDSPTSVFVGIQKIIIEVHPMDNDKRNEAYLTTFLQQKGYAITTHPGENGCPSLIAVKPNA